MASTTLEELLERNESHVQGLAHDHFAAVQDGQAPAAVSMTCADSRVPQSAMFGVDDPGWLFTPSTIGNQVWDRVDGSRVLDGSVHYPLVETETETALVVGHTGCGAVTAALAAVRGEGEDLPAGIEKWVEGLVPVVEAGLADERVDPDGPASLLNQLVEFNVDRQIEFLRERAPDGVETYGFVYDFQQVYGEEPGRAFLVNANGKTDVEALRRLVPDRFENSVRRLL